MENEKKNSREQAGGERDNLQPRRKGYFITPANEEGKRETSPSPLSEKSSAAPNGDGHHNAKGNGRSRHRRGHGNRSPKQSEDAANSNPQKKLTAQEERKEASKEPQKTPTPRQNVTPTGSDAPKQEKTALVKDADSRSHSRRSRKKNHNKNASIGQSPQIQSSESTPEASVSSLSNISWPTASRSENRLKTSLDAKFDPLLPQDDDEPIDASTLSPDVLESPPSMAMPDESIPRVEVIGIRFKSSGKIYYFTPADKKYTRGSHVIVETARGLEFGEIVLANTHVKESDVVPPLRPVIRVATAADIARHDENIKKEKDAFRICTQKIQEHKLEMKLIDAQYTFDNSKLLFYFTSAGRVDFRELVKDLAGVFRTRIELRQIGIRDEAKMMGGLGMCGRPLCCSVFLSDFCQVSIKMAKEQNFSLNSSKISGICGRLMCCLRYEHETYEYEIKRTPPVNSVVETPDGNGVVIENSPLVGTVKVRLSVTPEVAPKVYRREDVTVLQKKQTPQGNQNPQQKK